MVHSEEGSGSTMGGVGSSSPNWRVDIIGEVKDTPGAPSPIVWLNDIEVCLCVEVCLSALLFLVSFCPALF